MAEVSLSQFHIVQNAASLIIKANTTGNEPWECFSANAMAAALLIFHCHQKVTNIEMYKVNGEVLGQKRKKFRAKEKEKEKERK